MRYLLSQVNAEHTTATTPCCSATQRNASHLLSSASFCWWFVCGRELRCEHPKWMNSTIYSVLRAVLDSIAWTRTWPIAPTTICIIEKSLEDTSIPAPASRHPGESLFHHRFAFSKFLFCRNFSEALWWSDLNGFGYLWNNNTKMHRKFSIELAGAGLDAFIGKLLQKPNQKIV